MIEIGQIPMELLVGLALLSCLFIAWLFVYGFLKGLVISLARFAWIVPLFTLLYPHSLSEKVPSKVGLTKINVLIDDSESMKSSGGFNSTLHQVEQKVAELKSKCSELGCQVVEHKMSEFSSEVGLGKTPLLDFTSSVVNHSEDVPWVLFTDGGDKNPRRSVDGDDFLNKSGIVFGMGIEDEPNIWLSSLEIPSFGFAGKVSNVGVVVNRNKLSTETQNIQVQVKVDGKNVAAANVRFGDRDKSKYVEIVVPPQVKGHHLVSVSSLPIKSEKLIWDNMLYSHFETVPNTIGVLHLSGSPTADARFMRRFIKSEPKIDLISFFILRDPWDSQFVSEREMSLIPFPAERLFTQELANFKLVIIQNFRMLQFLNSKYQKNLVDFVENGGGLLFVGGPRGFNESDILSENLKRILPFKIKGKKSSKSSLMMATGGNNDKPSKTVPWFEKGLDFNLKLAKISESKRELATVYEDIADLMEPISKAGNLAGIHHMENVDFDKDGYTKILEAKTKKGNLPFMSASYPGKGRAIWLYSDQLWKLATSEKTSRDLYNKLNQRVFNWLIRDDIKKPLSVSEFEVYAEKNSTFFSVGLLGPAVRYYEHDESWKLSMCGRILKPSEYSFKRKSNLEIELAGVFRNQQLDGRVCELKVDANHKSFGNEKLTSLTYISKSYFDKDLPYSSTYLARFSEKVGVPLVIDEGEFSTKAETFIRRHTDDNGISLPPKTIVSENRYWYFQSLWIWLALLALPLEVLVRRWDKIMG
jgi:hypothetical protein